jgi:predicted AlkP superfamily phosphohydrolase/phosphomutase
VPRRALSFLLLLGCGALASAPPSSSAAAPESSPAGIFVLGIDGVDPVILDRLMSEGRMPNFARLAKEGTYQTLGTSTPPQSPVAWSNFITGRNPGGHGMFDFIHRDPKTYQPLSSATRPPSDEPIPSVELFGYTIPLGGDELVNNRSGIAFWDVLHRAGVDVEVYRIPGNYPPTPSGAKTLAGMGTVDMRGEYGTYNWYSNKPSTAKKHLKADYQLVTVEDSDLDSVPDTIHAILKGPPDILHLKPGELPGPNDFLTTGLTVHIDPEEAVAWLEVGGEDLILRQGEWSDWVEVSFDALPWGLMSFTGIVRFYLKQVRPEFQLYASPVNLAPGDPAQPLTTPDDFIEILHEKLGNFYTQGMPEETNALKDGLFDDDDYRKQVKLFQEEDSDPLLDLALSRFEPGMTTFFYNSDVDLQCHMLWRHGDPRNPGAPRHPAWEEEAAREHAGDIEGYYERVDRVLGRVRGRLPEGTLLVVMSDHGHQPYARMVHLNAWLRDEGYLVLAQGKKTGHIVSEGDVDWSRTRAYGLGFNGLYLNLAGREGQGIVRADQADELMAEISRKLEAWRDPKDGAQVVLRVDRARDVYSGERMAEAPDMIVGYNVRYGTSDASTLGEITASVLEDNTSRWSGSHLMAPEVVPGILLVNRKLRGSGYDLTDVTATLLDHYGLPPAEGMVGRSIFAN